MVLNLLIKRDVKDLCEVAALSVRRRICHPKYRPEVFYSNVFSHAPLSFEKTASPLVTIIIPCRNEWAFTHSCLYAIRNNTTAIPCEIVVADDTSTDETENIANLVAGVTVVRNTVNLGFLRNCNNAANTAKGKYLVFLNNDTNVQKGWLNSLLETIERDPMIGMVGPKFVYPDGKLQEAGGIIWNDASGWNYGKWDDPDRQQYNFARETDYISGACLMIRKALWEEIGGFDERYAPAYYEDSDLAFEVRKRGFKVVYQPASVVVHFEGTTCGTDSGKGIKKYQEINRAKFFRKWETVLKNEHFLPGQVRYAVKSAL